MRTVAAAAHAKAVIVEALEPIVAEAAPVIEINYCKLDSKINLYFTSLPQAKVVLSQRVTRIVCLLQHFFAKEDYFQNLSISCLR